MIISPNRPFINRIMGIVQHYNHTKYWKLRQEVVNPQSKKPKLILLLYLYYIKRCDAFNNSTMGTDLGQGAFFYSPPILPHHFGIVIAHNATIGRNCTIFQHVTITQGDEKQGAVIGDNCLIGAGAVILGGVHIGNNVKIGANAVVTHDIPSNATAIGVPAVVTYHSQVGVADETKLEKT